MHVAEFLVGNQCVRVDFDLPDNTWQLDSVEHVDRLVHFGREAAHQWLASLRESILDEATSEEMDWKNSALSLPSKAVALGASPETGHETVNLPEAGSPLLATP